MKFAYAERSPKKGARVKSLATGAVLLTLLSVLPAAAAPVINNFGITGATVVIDFNDNFQTGTPITNQYAALGATFSPRMCFNVQPEFFPTASLGTYWCGDDTFDPGQNTSILFSQAVSAAAIALQSQQEVTTFTALLGGLVVGFFTVETNSSFWQDTDLTHASDFYGFTGIVFDELRIENASAEYQIDNLQFTTINGVPEPTTLVLAASALAALAALGIRRRRRLAQR